ncbi:nucleotide kinase [Lysinibacillus piscis]|uniref:Nucleotide kinase n=1 Tax=Lysinibacillus piscis TaxID=2518931 RepID=A0ABQ5NI28_9BACI|nr:nucleotide kinase [Lysinibacillus sp. KH24]GLC88006.1 hypothetical protein LYSBPC_11330 [Lysinibacillus sp. KH24]
MNGQVTYYFGHALTGQGVKHLYSEMMEEAEQVYLLQGAAAWQNSELLKELGYFYVKQGFEVEWYKHALLEDVVEAVYIRGCNRLFIWSSEWGIEPTLLGTKHHVLSFYDCLETQQLEKIGTALTNATKERAVWQEKCIGALRHAIHIHDEWEVVTQSCMNWQGLNEQVEKFKEDVFQSISLNKEGSLTHRLLGTLTPKGADNTVDSITKDIVHRYMIKGKPGTGKSSLMKKLAEEANARGLDAQLIWCGLDAKSVDMVIIPELKFCIFDSTDPHIFYPQENRQGDCIFDMEKHCVLTPEAETQLVVIQANYKAAIQEALNYAKNYAEAEYEIRQLIDSCISIAQWREKTAPLFERLTK